MAAGDGPHGGRVLASETWGLPLWPGLRLALEQDSDEMVSYYPVLKHGPRSLTYVQVLGCANPVRNESEGM